MVDADQRFVRGKKTTKRSIIDFRSRAFLVTLSLFRNGGNIAFSGRLVQIKQRGGMEKRKENERSRLRGKIESKIFRRPEQQRIPQLLHYRWFLFQ